MKYVEIGVVFEVDDDFKWDSSEDRTGELLDLAHDMDSDKLRIVGGYGTIKTEEQFNEEPAD